MPESSEAERHFITQGIVQGIRTDGRGCTDYRPLQFELNIIAQAHGSARLHMGATDVIITTKVRQEPHLPYAHCMTELVGVSATCHDLEVRK